MSLSVDDSWPTISFTSPIEITGRFLTSSVQFAQSSALRKEAKKGRPLPWVLKHAIQAGTMATGQKLRCKQQH